MAFKRKKRSGSLSEAVRQEILSTVRGNRKKDAQTYIRFPQDIKDAAQICAASMGMSLSAFVVQAVAARVRNWRDPVTGGKVIAPLEERLGTLEWEGWTCSHASHGELPAAECPKRESPVHQKEMYHEELGLFGWLDLTKLTEEERLELETG